jgi:hypothetical protein
MKIVPLNPKFLTRNARTDGGLQWPPLLAIVTGSRRTGHAIITVTRRGRTHRHRVSLTRYAAVHKKLVRLPWRYSGGSMNRSSFDINLWGSESRWQTTIRMRPSPDQIDVLTHSAGKGPGQTLCEKPLHTSICEGVYAWKWVCETCGGVGRESWG